MTHMFLVADPSPASNASRVMKRIGRPFIDRTGLERTVFRNHKMELFVWRANGLTEAFELHYDIHTDREWSMLWTEARGISFHKAAASGCASAMIPIEPRQLPICDLHAEFVVRSRFIDEPVRRIVLIRLSEATRNYGAQS